MSEPGGTMNRPEPKFEVGDLVRRNITGQVGIVTKVEAIGQGGWGRYDYKITGVGWVLEHNLDLVSSVKDTQT